jgi:hypothetical protein
MWVVLVVFFALCGIVVIGNAVWTIRQMVLRHRRSPDKRAF